jgi:hypothetical protein
MVLNILVEGQTEETFVKDILAPYLLDDGVYPKPIILSTKITRDGKKFRGGLSNGNFERFIKELKRLLSSTPHGLVTTFIDYYALPDKFPKYEERHQFSKAIEKVTFLEQALFEYLNSPKNFLPYLQLHEFETFLFADPLGFHSLIEEEEGDVEALTSLCSQFENPEDINEGNETAPSKRILNHYESYDKVFEGNMMLQEVGIQTLLEKCPHFREWMNKVVDWKKYY